ncbi:phage tail tape measure protein [Pseudomonas alloputida]|uniref:phage tail tape measure protein n=1 Tax=Pseudomonas TaxID=286 RepID=UPI003EEEF1F0
MASKLALSLEIGGAVASSVGAAFRTVEGNIDRLAKKGDKAKVLKSTIGETMKLQSEWKRAHDTGAAGADKLLRKLNGNLEALRKQGVEVGRLGREYQRLAREAKAADLQVKGHQQIAAGKSSLKRTMGAAAVGVGLTAIPTKISADYQAIIRDIAIKADAAGKPQEVELSRSVILTSNDTGMARNDVADLINQLVGAGMDLDKAMSYASTAAKFAVGQGASGTDTAKMIQALEQNAKISDPKVMQQALEAIAYQGQAGSFEASDMARWFPQLLAGMEKSGITGLDAVTSLGSMLQVQMKTAGSSDEAANNFKNWMEKIGAGDVVKAYKDAGIDYQASLNTGLQKGMNVIEASMGLAMQYVQATDPAKAKKIQDAQAKIDKEVDPVKAKAALEALEKTLRTGDIFADMQVKAALTAYGQNRGLYNELKADSMKATGILDKNLAERRETSSQRWSELWQATDDAMRSIGDAIRPATDAFAEGATVVVHWITRLSDSVPELAMGLTGLAAAIGAVFAARSAAKIGRGVFNVARGRGLGRRRGGQVEANPTGAETPATGNPVIDAGLGALGKVLGAPASNDPGLGLGSEPQRVFVVNADAFGRLGSSGVGGGPDGPGGSRRARRRRRRQARSMGGAQAAPSPPPVKALAATAEAGGEVGKLGRMVRGVRGITRLAGKLPGGKLVDAVPEVLDTALNATTRDEKAEGYGSAAGGMAGAWAGGMAGAAIGSVVPVIGTAIGGAIGMFLGGLGGESVGGWLGKAWFGDDKDEPENAAGSSSKQSDQAAQNKPQESPAGIMPVPIAKAPTPVPAAPVVVEVPVPVVKAQDPVQVSQAQVARALDPVPTPLAPVSKGLEPPQPPVPAVSLPKALAATPNKPVDQMTDGEVERAYAKLPSFAKPDLFEGVGGFEESGGGLGRGFAPGVSLEAPPAKPRVEPPPVNQRQALGLAMRAIEQVPQAPTAIAPVINRVVERSRPGQLQGNQPDNGGAVGDVVKSLVESVKTPPAPAAAAVQAPDKAKPQAVKVEQVYQINLSMPITVEGDMKDPYQTVRALETPVRDLIGRVIGELASRQANVQLFDASHV